MAKKKKSMKKTVKRTIKASKLRHMALLNHPKMPQVVNDVGVRKRWVGIGWVDEGKPKGNEVVVVED